MKRNTLLLCALLLAAQGLLAQVSKITIFSEDGYPFQFVANGILQNANPQTNVQVPNLTPGPYKVRVIFSDTALGVINDKFFLDEFSEQTYVIKNKKISSVEKKFKSFGNTVAKDASFKSEQDADARKAEIEAKNSRFVIRMLNKTPYGAPAPAAAPAAGYAQPAPAVGYTQQTTTHSQPAQVGVTQQTTTVTSGTPAGGASIGVNMPGVNVNMNLGNGMGMSQTTHTTTTTHSGGGVAQTQVYSMPGYSGPTGCPWPMQPQDFQSAKATIASKSFEDSKLTIAQQIVGSNCLFASQVREIMALFDFEQSKLDFAKFAYGRTFDIGNYFKVNDAFQFETSIDELNAYIASRGGR